MYNLWRKIWYSEPIAFIGALTAGWTALAAFDKASNDFTLPIWLYVAAVVAVPVLGRLVRNNVTPINDG